jgi:predicted amidophosphoribosyltransferase
MIPVEPKGLCTSCNRAVDLDAVVCPHCNAPLETGGTRPLDVPHQDTSDE